MTNKFYGVSLTFTKQFSQFLIFSPEVFNFTRFTATMSSCDASLSHSQTNDAVEQASVFKLEKELSLISTIVTFHCTIYVTGATISLLLCVDNLHLENGEIWVLLMKENLKIGVVVTWILSLQLSLIHFN